MIITLLFASYCISSIFIIQKKLLRRKGGANYQIDKLTNQFLMQRTDKPFFL